MPGLLELGQATVGSVFSKYLAGSFSTPNSKLYAILRHGYLANGVHL